MNITYDLNKSDMDGKRRISIILVVSTTVTFDILTSAHAGMRYEELQSMTPCPALTVVNTRC